MLVYSNFNTERLMISAITEHQYESVIWPMNVCRIHNLTSLVNDLVLRHSEDTGVQVALPITC